MDSVSVIIADDHAMFCEGLQRLLELHGGIKVVGIAHSGDEAVKLVLQRKPDVVLMDISMRGEDGLRATRDIKQVSPQTKVLILTMHDRDKYLRRSMEAGASGYVLKEASASELRDAIFSVAPCNFAKGFHSGSVLTVRELEILRLAARGLTNIQIACSLNLSSHTVKNHLYNIYEKLGCSNRAEAVMRALEMGLLSNSN